MGQLLLAEDDPAISAPLERALRREGYEVVLVADGPTALAETLNAAAAGRLDLVVLDLGLPGMDGLEVCRRLRQRFPALPVLMLTARADELDTVVGLDAGADDYLTKPFRLAELLARLRALLRRSGAAAAVPVAGVAGAGGQDGQATVVNHGLWVDEAAHRAFVDGAELRLTAKEFDLLRVLVRERGRVVTRRQLMREVWETDWWQSTKTVDMHVSWLRRKLGDDPAAPRFITTVRGVGFRLELEPESPGSAGSSAGGS
ncbi:MAG: response regulator transcription factor [Frankiaceae bacterium]